MADHDAAGSDRRVIFEEVQDAPWPFTLLGLGGTALGGVAAARALTLAARLGVAGAVATAAGVALNQFLIPLRTTLYADELEVLFGKRTRFRIPLRNVEHAWARIYSPLWEYGGWGIRERVDGKAFTIRGNEGVQLVMRSGQRVLVGSENAEELARQIRETTSCMGEPGRGERGI